MAPIPLPTEADSAFEFCNCSATDTINCGVLILLFLLIFYALAVWDRWINLKTRELQHLRYREVKGYGTMKRTRASITVVPAPPYCASLTTPQPPTPQQYAVHNGMQHPHMIAAKETYAYLIKAS
ncbi:hypothetical protein CPB85DRAFT_1428570 [Mucidula mucida]|nr:hypothetical protein CPB85DRAFT_1428570 [Mucidula mucida]